MKVVSLFSGIGGFDLGLERAGMEIVAQVEIDKFCNRILQTRWPNVPRIQDIRDANASNLPRCDLLCGGFPCQDLSVTGKRAGLSGERSGLFWEFIRLARELRPAWLVLENVPGLLSSNGGRDMGAVIGGLEDAGYSCAWRVLDSQWFGVAQRRRRVFIVGHCDARCAGAVLFEPEGGAGAFANQREEGETVAGPLTLCAPGARMHCDASDNDHLVICASPDPAGVRDFAGLPKGLDGPRYRALGNAVTVPVIEWLGRRILMVEQFDSVARIG